MSEDRTINPRLPRNLMLAVSFVQGIALYLLWWAADNEVWPSQTPTIAYPLWTLALSFPVLLLFSLNRGNLARTLKATGLFTAVLMLLAGYLGWQATPHGKFAVGSLVHWGAITGLIASFTGLMYCQQWIWQARQGYEDLFAYSWRNFLVACLAVSLAWGVYLILYLWGELFLQIEIAFFEELFRKDWFRFPVLVVAFGVGVVIFRHFVQVIDSVKRILEGLIRLLLPLAAVVVVIFVGALPFTGLAPLWATGSGTVLLLLLSTLALFFVNAVYQTGRELPYPVAVHRLLSVAIALLPFVFVLALYGLYVRIDEYGLTVVRCLGFTLLVILALFSGGYTGLIVRWRTAWPERLGRVNTPMGWVVLAVMLLANSPLLDFRSMSLTSQLGRVAAGEIELQDFDFYYTLRHLARPGYLEMRWLIAQHELSDPELVQIIRDPVVQTSEVDEVHFREMWERVVYRPEPFELPTGLRAAIRRTGPNWPMHFESLVLIRIDLNADGEPDYVLLGAMGGLSYVTGWCFYRSADTWNAVDLRWQHQRTLEGMKMAWMLHNGEVGSVVPAFQDLNVGELKFRAHR